MKDRIGILCAGDREVAPFLPWMEGCAVMEKAMLNIHCGQLEGVEVAVLYSGVCKTNASIAAQILIDCCGCRAVINAGTAGGMAPQVRLLDTVITVESAYWDVAEDILTEFHPWMESIYFKADPGLLALARRVVAGQKYGGVHFGRMITGERFIEDAFRDEINRKHAPLTVDMETAAVAHACHVNRVPFIAVRTVTDTAEHSGMDQFDINCEKASHKSAEIVRAMLRELSGKGADKL